jgi:hypothetical protein
VNGSTSTKVSAIPTHHKLKNNTQTIVNNKIMLFGDSHVRGLSSDVGNNLDDNYSVCSLSNEEYI